MMSLFCLLLLLLFNMFGSEIHTNALSLTQPLVLPFLHTYSEFRLFCANDLLFLGRVNDLHIWQVPAYKFSCQFSATCITSECDTPS